MVGLPGGRPHQSSGDKLLTALARAVVKYRAYVIGCWVVIAALALPRAARVNEVLEAEGRTLTTTESDEVKHIIRTEFEQSTANFMAIVMTGPAHIDTPRYRRLLQRLTAAVEQESYVDGVASYLTTEDENLVSEDGRTTFFLAVITDEYADVAGRTTVPLRETVRRVTQRMPEAEGFQFYVTGQPALDFDARAVTAEDAKTGELRSLLPTMVVLVLAFGALVAAVLPLLIGMFAISISLAAVYMTASFFPMSVFVLTIITMVGLAVGIDYSLLIVNRFREQMNRGQPPAEAAIRSITTAGKAVITSGLTVIVGFAALLTTPINETRSVGIGGMYVVTAAVFLAITLLPATLAVMGRTIDWPFWLARRLAWYHKPTAWERWARWLAKHPIRALTIGLFVAGLFTWPMFHIKVGLPASGWFPAGIESSEGAELIEEVGSRGALLPIRITLQAPEGERLVSSTYLNGLRRFSDSIKVDPRVHQVRGAVDLGISRLGYLSLFGNLERFKERYPDFFKAYVSNDGRTVLFDVTLMDSTSYGGAMDAVRRIRSVALNGVPGLDSVDVNVGGFAAGSLDLQNNLLDGFPLVVLLVVSVTAVMLFIAFRSVLVPIKAVLMNLLSVTGAFGLMVLVFQEGIGASLLGLQGPTEAVYVVTPVLVFAVVFGLSMDYEVFLLSRMKEAFDRTGKNDVATMEGLSVTASVITSAAAIMIIVFGTFAFTRMLAAKMMGFGLAVAVLLDATLIRMVLVPAFMHIAGRWNWWPGVKVAKITETEEEVSET